ncbi:MAG: hypothetical protein ACTSUF_01975 [Candidatus Heimdallarchaeaceae archaeon]
MELITSDCCGTLYITSLCDKNTFTVKPQQKLPFDFIKAKEILLKLFPGKDCGKISYEFKMGDITISLLRNFAMNISGVDSIEEALNIYKRVINAIQGIN